MCVFVFSFYWPTVPGTPGTGVLTLFPYAQLLGILAFLIVESLTLVPLLHGTHVPLCLGNDLKSGTSEGEIPIAEKIL